MKSAFKYFFKHGFVFFIILIVFSWAGYQYANNTDYVSSLCDSFAFYVAIFISLLSVFPYLASLVLPPPPDSSSSLNDTEENVHD